MSKTVKEIAAAIGGEVVGDGQVRISGVAGIQDAGEGDLTFLADKKYLAYLSKTGASAIIVSRDTGPQPKTIIRTDNPSLAFVRVVDFILPQWREHFRGVHPSAVVGAGVSLGKNVALGPHVVLEDGVQIGDDSVIYAGSVIGRQAKIGARTVLYPHVTVFEKTTIGSRVVIHSGTVIGSDGFGFVTVAGVHHKIPQTGIVVIEDDVEIGANVTIDRARFEKTVIGEGTKVDNLVQIGHNVRIGKNCLIVAQVGVAGSTVIGNNVVLAGQVGTVGHITIGDNCVVMAKSGVNKSLAAGSVVWGVPARPADEARLISACIQNLPKWHVTIRELKNRLAELEKQK